MRIPAGGFACESLGCAPGSLSERSAGDRDRLEAIVADRNSPQKQVWRARIVLATAEGLGTMAVMHATGKSKTAVWRWQERFCEAGVDGLLRDKTRPSPVKPEVTAFAIVRPLQWVVSPGGSASVKATIRSGGGTVRNLVCEAVCVMRARSAL
jgi:hypothetical protein